MMKERIKNFYYFTVKKDSMNIVDLMNLITVP